MDPYSILGVSRTAGDDEIKKAYRKLANETHPDRPEGDADKFKEVAAAYEILSDPRKRLELDNPNSFRGFNPFENFFRTAGFDMHFGFNAGPRQPPQHGSIQGSEIRQALRIDVFDILLNNSLILTYDRHEHCPECGGRGSDLMLCNECRGLGFVSQMFEAGHQKIRRDGPCQTCQGRCFVKQNSCSKCNGDGLVITPTEQLINLGQAVAGGGHIVLPECGHYGPFQGPPGPLIIDTQIWFPTPDTVTPEARELLQQAAALIIAQGGGRAV